MSQVAAGKKYGALNEIDGVSFQLKKSEIAQLEKMGLIPMVNEYGKVMPFSAKTLFNGDNIGLQTYSVVRVFDYVTKVLIDFLNRRAFENFNVNTRMDIQRQIVKFLDSVTGPGKLIEKFIKAVEASVMDTLLGGGKVDGFKLVEGRSVRQWTDAAKPALEDALGMDAFTMKLIGIGEAEKLIGKDAVADLVIKPDGKPTLALATAKGKEISATKTEDQFDKLT